MIKELSLLIPSPSPFWAAVWYWPGAFGYHLLYLKELWRSNYQVRLNGPKMLTKNQVRRQYPGLTALHGQYGVTMAEAQMHDSRMCLNTLFTAAIDNYHKGMVGATLVNYCEFKDFTKDENGKITGGVCVDTLDKNAKPFNVKAKVVVNCAGVHADVIRQKAQPEKTNRIVPSRGTHLIFKKGFFQEEGLGLIVPETTDGRLLFVINYMGYPMVGTTDEFCEATHNCGPSEAEIDFLIEEIKPFLGKDYDYKGNLLSAWAGLRPLVKSEPSDVYVDPDYVPTIRDKVSKFFQARLLALSKWVHKDKKKSSTAAISRNHVIEVLEESGLVSLMGGKWTAYRVQGEQTTDRLLKLHPDLAKKVVYEKGQTLNFHLIGSYSKCEVADGLKIPYEALFKRYEDHFVFEYGVQRECAKQIVREYGTTGLRVMQLGKQEGLNERIVEDMPFLKSQILYAIRYEMAQKPNDVLCRRVPVSFLDEEAAKTKILPVIIDIFAKEFKWDKKRQEEETQVALENL